MISEMWVLGGFILGMVVGFFINGIIYKSSARELAKAKEESWDK